MCFLPRSDCGYFEVFLMDLYRAFLAIIISFLILVGYQYFVTPLLNQPGPAAPQAQQAETVTQNAPVQQPAPAVAGGKPQEMVAVNSKARDVHIDTPLYKAVIKEQGGGIASFVLKDYRTSIEKDSGPMQLVLSENIAALPVLFSLDNGAGAILPLFTAEKTEINLKDGKDEAKLVMTASMAEGITITRTMTFRGSSYLIDVQYKVENPTDMPISIAPALSLDNPPFSHASQASEFLFYGPAAYANDELIETKPKTLAEKPVVLQGKIGWAGYVDSYFMTAVIPSPGEARTVTFQGSEQLVRTVFSEGLQTLTPKGEKTFVYTLYFGPKKLKILQETPGDLAKAVNFGWFDVLAKPMLWLLNFFHDYVKNYGVAIILVTILIKLCFWPITQKGMQSMKNMQKLQPKVAKLREKYKADPAKMNQEMMALYKTYKVNPVGGCLPMLIQIPFFFALYRVLMAAIELRHAPFMLWMNDLSAPDRLWVGVDIPYLHGIPVLTLLMGASMFLQQKMTPTTADPTQAKIMQFLPVIFTFMFINFASGLVLYWFINNLLSILQQQLINRKNKA